MLSGNCQPPIPNWHMFNVELKFFLSLLLKFIWWKQLDSLLALRNGDLGSDWVMRIQVSWTVHSTLSMSYRGFTKLPLAISVLCHMSTLFNIFLYYPLHHVSIGSSDSSWQEIWPSTTYTEQVLACFSTSKRVNNKLMPAISCWSKIFVIAAKTD